MTKAVLLCDVDGVIIDLMGGFRKHLLRQHGLTLEIGDISRFDISKSPELVELDATCRKLYKGEGELGGIGGAFTHWMNNVWAYDGLDPIPGALDAIKELRGMVDIVFVTAMMKKARSHFQSKMEWLDKNCPGLPVITSPSGLKHQVRGQFGVDDRYDTCQRWEGVGTAAFLFKQPWSEAPDGTRGHDWSTIVPAIESIMRRRSE